MKHTYILLVVLSLFYCVDSKSEPALGELQVRLQPDGTELLVRLNGDEYYDYLTTPDGYIIKKNDRSWYEYIITDEQGEESFSGVVVHDTGYRTAEETRFLATARKGLSDRQRERWAERRDEGMRKLFFPEGEKDGLRAASQIGIGSMKVLILLINYKDQKFIYSREEFEQFFNQPGYRNYEATGSVRDFFEHSSFDQFHPEFVIVGPVELPENMSYYGGEGGYASRMVTHGCEIAHENGLVDFSEFDADNNGVVDVVYCLYAGYSRSQGGPAESVWPHASSVSGGPYDGKKLGRYACSSELRSGSGTEIVGCGTFCHEFGHVLGLPDFYDVDGEANGYCQTPGSWSTMSSGNYMNKGRNPPLYTAYERDRMGWLDIHSYTIGEQGSYELGPLYDTNQAYKIDTKTEGDFFVLEYRKRKGFDAHLAGDGLLIWHIDRSEDPILYNGKITTPAALWNQGAINRIAGHPLYDVVEAVFVDPSKNSPMDANVLFPGSTSQRFFTDETTPAMKSWAGKDAQKPISCIRLEDDKIRFELSMEDLTNNGGTITASHPKPSDQLANPELAIDNDPDTYYQRAVPNATSYWIQYESSEPAVLSGYAIAASTEAAGWDPEDWWLWASDDDENWELLDEKKGQNFSKRRSLNLYPLENDRIFSFYRLEVTKPKGGQSAGVRFAEWNLFGETWPKSPSDLIAKWDRVNKCVRISWKDNSINEESFLLERSENGGDFFPIATLDKNADTYIDQEFEQTKLLFYQYRVKAVAGSRESDWSEIASANTEITLTKPDGLITAQYTVKPVDQNTNPVQLIDQNENSVYLRLAPGATSYWVQYETDSIAFASAYAIIAGKENLSYNPKDWSFLGSEDGESWDSLDVRQDETFEAGEYKEYEIFANQSYHYFRLNVTGMNGGVAMQMAEWIIYGWYDFPTRIETTVYGEPGISTVVSAASPWHITSEVSRSRVAVRVYNLMGIEVYSKEGYTNDWTGLGIPNGIYIYRVDLGNGYPALTGRLVVSN